jgi:hypothetical protein
LASERWKNRPNQPEGTVAVVVVVVDAEVAEVVVVSNSTRTKGTSKNGLQCTKTL